MLDAFLEATLIFQTATEVLWTRGALIVLWTFDALIFHTFQVFYGHLVC